MSCGCAVVSTATCMIPEIIENGVNGFISNDHEELKQYFVDLLNDEGLAKEIGNNARKTITEKYSASKFVDRWNEILKLSSNLIFRG